MTKTDSKVYSLLLLATFPLAGFFCDDEPRTLAPEPPDAPALDATAAGGDEPDASAEDGAVADAATEDGGFTHDVGVSPAGLDAAVQDAGFAVDAGELADAGLGDAGLADAGLADAGLATDAGLPSDAGELADAAITDAAGATPDASVAPRVFFVAPRNGDVIAAQTVLTAGVEGFQLVPAIYPIAPGTGHLHILIDAPCVAPGSPIAATSTQLDLAEAQSGAFVELSQGQHTLCLQAGDSAHVALDLTDVITVTVL